MVALVEISKHRDSYGCESRGKVDADWVDGAFHFGHDRFFTLKDDLVGVRRTVPIRPTYGEDDDQAKSLVTDFCFNNVNSSLPKVVRQMQ